MNRSRQHSQPSIRTAPPPSWLPYLAGVIMLGNIALMLITAVPIAGTDKATIAALTTNPEPVDLSPGNIDFTAWIRAIQEAQAKMGWNATDNILSAVNDLAAALDANHANVLQVAGQVLNTLHDHQESLSKALANAPAISPAAAGLLSQIAAGVQQIQQAQTQAQATDAAPVSSNTVIGSGKIWRSIT